MADKLHYLNSEQVKVFPSTRRSIYDAYSRETQESTYADITNRICGDGSFIITQVEMGKQPERTEPFEFELHGYYFKIDRLTSLFNLFEYDDVPSGAVLYACIALDIASPNIELIGHEEDLSDDEQVLKKYTGLMFTTNPTSLVGKQYHKLPLFIRVEDPYSPGKLTWNLVQKSYIRLPSEYVDLDIDGGIF